MLVSFKETLKDIGKVGSTGVYIKDYFFDFVSEILGTAALQWVREVAPNALLGGRKKACDIKLEEVQNKWSGKKLCCSCRS